MPQLKTLSLFTGIGGFELAALSLPDNPFVSSQFVEIDSDAIAVLGDRFSGVPLHEDIRTYFPQRGEFDVVWGGFPCTNTSQAGDKKGLEGSQSSLWWEMHRVVLTVRPKFLCIENPRGLQHRGLAEIIRSLAAVGYVGEWQSISAAHVGAPHQRSRIFIVSYPDEQQYKQGTTCWADQIRAVVEAKYQSRSFPTFERADAGIAVRLPSRLDASFEISSLKGTKGKIRSRYLYGKTVVPAQAAIALSRIAYLNRQIIN